MAELTAERLRDLVRYDPVTGLFTCRVARRNRVAGDVESRIAGTGYIAFCVDGRQYTAHRLAWLYVHGHWPSGEVDHINNIRTDNSIANLREASRRQNSWNVGVRTANLAGLKGVFPNKRRWSAQIKANGVQYHLGTFDAPEEAHAAYVDAAHKHHGDFARS